MEKELLIKPIFINVNGTKIEGGIIDIEPNNIRVKILSPFGDATNSLNIPDFVIFKNEELFLKNDHITKKGIDTAEFLLNEIYFFCEYFENEHDHLKKIYDNNVKDLTKKYKKAIDLDAFNREKLKIKDQFLNNKINKKLFNEKIRTLRSKYEENWQKQLMIETQLREYIEKDLKKIINADLLHQLIKKYLI